MVLNNAMDIKANKTIKKNGKDVKADGNWDICRYSCSDFLSDLLPEVGYSKDIGNITVEYNNKSYTKKTPNTIFLDIAKSIKPIKSSSKITVENAKKYMQNYLKNH